MNEVKKTAERLCEVSRASYLNPYLHINWSDRLEPEQWFMSPELISLYGTEVYESLPEVERQKLSFYESVNFFSLNIHGEKSLVEGLAKRLYKRDLSELSDYLHHFLDEENKHMVYFGGFCQRYAGKIYRDRKMILPRNYAEGEEDFLFFAKVMIFEELADYYNIRMANDQSLEAMTRQINTIHHLEEARHLVFGRTVVKMLFEKFAPSWSADVLDSIRAYLTGYLEATWKEYYNPDVYRDAGLNNAYDLVEMAWSSIAACLHRKRASEKCLRFFTENGILPGEQAA